MAEPPPPETPTGAARALIAWFAGALAFQCVETFAKGAYLPSASYGIAAIIVAAVDYELPSLLSGRPELTGTLNRAGNDARWWVGAILAAFVLLGVAPLVGLLRTPAKQSPVSQTQSPHQSAPPPSGPPQEAKVVLDTDIYQLEDLTKNRTDAEAARLLSPYSGKWLSVSGEIKNLELQPLREYNIEMWLLVLQLPPGASGGFPLWKAMTFKEEWKDRLLALPYGQHVVALCQVASRSSLPLALENCELVAPKGSDNAPH